MVDTNRTFSQPMALSQMDESAKTHVLIAYVLMVTGIFTGITWIMGGIWAMVKKSDAKGTIFIDHYDNLIITFWVSLAVSVIAFPLCFIIIGYFLLFILWVWVLYRLIRGLIRLSNDRPYR